MIKSLFFSLQIQEEEGCSWGGSLYKIFIDVIKQKKSSKGKSVKDIFINFTTCTTIVLSENIERYNKHYFLVTQSLLGYVSTLNNFKLDQTLFLMWQGFTMRGTPLFPGEKEIEFFWLFFASGLCLSFDPNLLTILAFYGVS